MTMNKIHDAVKVIQSKITAVPKIGLILGSGLGSFVDEIEVITSIPYSQIPHFHQTTVEGHDGKLIFGKISNKDVVVLSGRIHAYEGHTMEDVVHPVRVMGKLGINHLFISNASGGINPYYKPGDIVMIKDHLNLSGKNPLVGPNLSELGTRFPDMSDAYNKNLRELFLAESKKLNIQLAEGVYCWLSGPSYETPAEIRMLSVLGADMVGMSTVPEVIAAHHMGIKVAGISCITNYAAGIKDEKLSHDDVKHVAQQAMQKFKAVLKATISKV